MKSVRGFTLVEVLVALVIVALGMGAALKALSSAADSTARLREKTFAEWVGFNQLSTERLKVALPVAGTKQGDLDFASQRWHWEQTVADMDVPGLKRITILVRHADDSGTPRGAAQGVAAGVDWLATVVGFRGDALQSPLSILQGFDGAGIAQPGQGPGFVAGPGVTP